jgi:hypothetical protein
LRLLEHLVLLFLLARDFLDLPLKFRAKRRGGIFTPREERISA